MAVKNHKNSVNLQQVEGDAGFSKYVKGVPISNKSYTKEVHFLTKLLYINRVRPRCKVSPVQNFVEYPRPGLSDFQKTRRLSKKKTDLSVFGQH